MPTHYQYAYTTQELARRFSSEMIKRAAAEVAAMDQANAAGTYRPTLESLACHPCPEWFEDAKFGMFIDWGLYSVAGWGRPNDKKPDGPTYPDWYLWDMYEKEPTRQYHARHWGADFGRDDFVPLFTAADYDPAGIAALARQAGMRYVVPFCKHHDGFCLWDCAWTFRDAADMSPGRDLLGPLAQAVRDQGLKFGAYFSVEEWEYPILGPSGNVEFERQWEFFQPRLAPYDAARLTGRIGGKVPVRDFVKDYLIPQCKELIDKYDPDLLWYDGEWKAPVEQRGTLELAAYFYNRAAGRKEVAVNDRYGEPCGQHWKSRGFFGDFLTSEYNIQRCQSLTRKWEECRSIGQYYGYHRLATDRDVLSATQLVHMLADIVSRNGNLLLVVNPDGAGALPENEITRLRAVGEWLAVNGEAIYATGPLPPHRAGDVLFTKSKDGRFAHAIMLAWPADNRLVLPPQIHAQGGGNPVIMLGDARPLDCSPADDGMVVHLPEPLSRKRPCDHAWVVRVPLR